VLGFALVFVALGASASVIGARLAVNRAVLNATYDLFTVAMGLMLLAGYRKIGFRCVHSAHADRVHF